MSYRNIVIPTNYTTWQTTAEWIAWMNAEKLLLPVPPRLDGACERCFGSVGYDSWGDPYEECYHCGGYDWDGLTLCPISYSVDAGMESLLHLFKDRPGYRWARYALGSLLAEFFQHHLSCLQQALAIDVASMVPSGSDDRSWTPASDIVNSISGWLVTWDLGLIAKAKPGRVQRGRCEPDHYAIRPNATNGLHVLLVDDTWTSGASTISCARALIEAGARQVTIVTFGRQLNAHGPGTSENLHDTATARAFDLRRCIICG